MILDTYNNLNPLPSFFSIANQKNRRICFFEEPTLPFIVFLKTPNYFVYSFEPNPTDTVSTAISFISHALSVSPDTVFLANNDGVKLDECTILSKAFQSEDIILVSVDGKIAIQAKSPAKDEISQENINKIVELGYNQSSAKAALTMAKNVFTDALELLISNSVPDIDEKNDENKLHEDTATPPTSTATPPTSTATPPTSTATPPTSTTTPPTSTAKPFISSMTVVIENSNNVNQTVSDTTTDNTEQNDTAEASFDFSDAQTVGQLDNQPTIYQLKRSLTPKQRAFVERLVAQYGSEDDIVLQFFIMNNKDERLTEEMVAGMV